MRVEPLAEALLRRAARRVLAVAAVPRPAILERGVARAAGRAAAGVLLIIRIGRVGGGVERVEAPPDAAARDGLEHAPEARL